MKQCALLGISRSSLYYQPRGPSKEDLVLMKLMDQQYLARVPTHSGLASEAGTPGRPEAGSALDADHEPPSRRPRTSQPAPGHKVYPYLLRGMGIIRPNQVWAADITYIPMAKGFLYIMDWYSRYVLAWRLSNTLDTDFCLDALGEALGKDKPEVFNTSREPVHQPGLYRRAGRAWGEGEHGRERALHR